MTADLPSEFVDKRLADQLAELVFDPEVDGGPLTLEAAMQFVRAAYARGYLDSLNGVRPETMAVVSILLSLLPAALLAIALFGFPRGSR